MSGQPIWIYLISSQICVFVFLFVLIIVKIIKATRNSKSYLKNFFILLSVYVFFQLSIQIQQLIAITIYDKTPDQNANMVLGINICCIILDLHILLMLNFLWEDTSSSIVQTVQYSQTKTSFQMIFKQTITLVWLVCYIGYFVYLCTTQQLTISNKKKQNGDSPANITATNKVVLYIVCQSISGFLLLLCLLWQAISWSRLQKNIEQIKIILKKNIKVNRIKLTFWSTSIFNLGRTMFITVLVVLAFLQKYNSLIICLNIFISSSCLPIFFYLVGFKFQQSGSQHFLSSGQQRQSKSKKSHSHQTQLSYRSQKGT